MHLAAHFVALMAAEDAAVAKAVIVAGLEERWGLYEPKYNPDLEDFQFFYKDSVVLVAKNGIAVVGVGILQPENAEKARIVRMSVSLKSRRQGIGSSILLGLVAAARQQGFKDLGLETTASWRSAVEFYKKHGFAPTKIHEGDQYFSLAASEA